jgi:hypothetical protein
MHWHVDKKKPDESAPPFNGMTNDACTPKSTGVVLLPIRLVALAAGQVDETDWREV